MGSKYKKGDLLIHGYDIVEVSEMEKGEVSDLRDGYFCTGGRFTDDDFRPMTVDNFRVAQAVRDRYESIYKLGGNGLNFSAIHNAYGNLCYKIIDFQNAEKIEEAQAAWKELEDFTDTIKNACEAQRALKVGGIHIFGR